MVLPPMPGSSLPSRLLLVCMAAVFWLLRDGTLELHRSDAVSASGSYGTLEVITAQEICCLNEFGKMTLL